MNVGIRIGDTVASGWQRYDVEIDLSTPADGFSLSFAPGRRDLWDLCEPDQAAQVVVAGTPVLSGFIDSRRLQASRAGSSLEVTGRCRIARLVDESMELVSFDGLSLVDLMTRVAGPWFSSVTLSNARNRALVRGRRAPLARVAGEPVIVDRDEAPRRVEPGETRWDVAQRFLEPARLLAWSSGDGRELVVGKPNDRQEPQFRFRARAGAASNVESYSLVESVADRYSQVTVVGVGRGDARSGRRGRTRAVVSDGPGAEGVGRSFRHRKQLLVADDGVRNQNDAERRAAREMAVRDASGVELELRVRGHGQAREPGGREAIYAPDTVAEFEDAELGLRGRYLVVSVRFEGSRDGRFTTLGLVPVGTPLVI